MAPISLNLAFSAYTVLGLNFQKFPAKMLTGVPCLSQPPLPSSSSVVSPTPGKSVNISGKKLVIFCSTVMDTGGPFWKIKKWFSKRFLQTTWDRDKETDSITVPMVADLGLLHSTIRDTKRGRSLQACGKFCREKGKTISELNTPSCEFSPQPEGDVFAYQRQKAQI